MLNRLFRARASNEQSAVTVAVTTARRSIDDATAAQAPDTGTEGGRAVQKLVLVTPGESDKPDEQENTTEAIQSLVRAQATDSAVNQKVVTQFTQLPGAAKMYGVGKNTGSLTKEHKYLLGALIHEDGTASILLTVEAQRTAHLRTDFIEAVAASSTIVAELLVTAAVLASTYAHYGDDTMSESTRVTQQTGNSHARQFAFDMIGQAMSMEASDIHLEIRQSQEESHAKVRFRIDGDMEDIVVHAQPAAIDVAKKSVALLFQGDYADDRSRSNTQQSEIVQQHALVRIDDLRHVALRYQSIIDKDGYDLILRLLTYDGKAQTLLDLHDMGLEPDQVECLIDAVSRPYGASFLGGSTGSGKTTLMAGLMHADPLKKKRKRYTAEDPVEINMPDVTQVNVTRAANDMSDGPFVEVMKGFLRGDPDLAMVGEIRERATASLMMQLALSGHNVWATLHINRMFDALYRLTDEGIGVNATVLGSNTVLNLLSSQTLVKRVCTCAVSLADALKRDLIDKKTVASIKAFGLATDKMVVANVNGEHNKNECPRCSGKGEKGRTLLAELTLMDDELKDLVMRSQFEEVERVYRRRRKTGLDEPGMNGKTILDHGFLKAGRGEICVNRLKFLGNKDLSEEFASRRFRGYIDA